MKVYYCDLSGVTTKKDLFVRMLESLELEEGSASNLDALADVIGEFRSGDTIIVYNGSALRSEMPAYYASFEKMGEDFGIRFYP